MEPPAPWKSAANDIKKAINKHLPVDALVFGIADLDRPQLDEVLYSHGFAPDSIQSWRTVGYQRDSLFRAAQATGTASGLLGDTSLTGSGLGDNALAVCELLPTTLGERRYWWVTAARKNEPFSMADRERLRFLLDQWRSALQRHSERGAGTAIAGFDNRCIYADPFVKALLHDASAPVDAFLLEIRNVFLQRWPDMPLDESHDIVYDIGGASYWIFGHRRRPLPSERSEHWVFEFRPLEKEELPSNGLLPDERIARAVALIHDRYHDGPSLTEMANLVHISPFHFHRLFTKQVGQSPKQYLLHKQLQIGRWRLRLGMEQIGDIAIGTGFANHAHFTSTFRRSLRMSPSEYQQKFMSRLGDELLYGAKLHPRKKRKIRKKTTRKAGAKSPGRPRKKKTTKKKRRTSA
jgi:AraC-like DNA-binding protein